MGIIEVENLTFHYPESENPAIHHLSLSIHAGDFFVLFGPSGCGKSTFLRHLKPQLTPQGSLSGEILFNGQPVQTLEERKSVSEIGFVMQSPDNQIVTDKVWHELAFGLESLGYSTPVIRRRVSEMASFFGIQNWFHKDVSELSGGQKQLLSLASVMVMQPSVLILDEPTAQLDPIAAADFLATLKKINTELGTTILLTEHRLEDALPLANRAAVMENGSILCCGDVTEVAAYLRNSNHCMFSAMPVSARVWGAVHADGSCPVSVKEGRTFLKEYTAQNGFAPVQIPYPHEKKDTKLAVRDVWFRYDRDLPDAVKGVHLSASAGELLCILGGNATGKTTLLRLISGCCKPYRGEIQAQGRVCLLPQNPQALFVKKTVYEDLAGVVKEQKIAKQEMDTAVNNMIALCRLNGLEGRHPYDLSGGEQQRLALAKLLLSKPDILLFDEPTKGFDAEFKKIFGSILKKLMAENVCIIMVSHDIEFCAEYADRCALFFDGTITAQGTPHAFFSGNRFYTTAANRLSRDIIPDVVTTAELIGAVGGEVQDDSAALQIEHNISHENNTVSVEESDKLPMRRKIAAGISAALALCVYFFAAKNNMFDELPELNGLAQIDLQQILVYGLLILFVILTGVFAGRKSSPPVNIRTPKEKGKLSKRTRLAVVIILLFIPITLYIGVAFADVKQYYFIALAVLFECMLPFFMAFEGRKPKARELVVVAVLCALGIAGRSALFMLPQFKPVIALTIIAGVAFGGETGFLVGAVTMLVSNLLFSQGPWTPWQMFAMGIIGFLAGILFQKGWLRRSKLSLCVFGAVSAILIYGVILNFSSALLWGGEALNWNLVLSYFITGFPFDCIQAVSTAVFLWLIAEPMLDKLDRIKTKYGLVQ